MGGRTPALLRDVVECVGGPTGSHAVLRSRSWWQPLRLYLLLSLVFLGLGFLTKANCIQGTVVDGGVVELDWGANRQLVSACYTDLVPLYAHGAQLSHYMNFPAVSALILWACSLLATLLYPLVSVIPGPTLPESGLFFCVVALFSAAMWLLCLRMVADITGPTGLVYGLAASPIVAVHAFTNFDTAAIAASISVLWAVQRGKVWLAGIGLGMGMALKLWPALLIIALLVVGMRDRSKLREHASVAGIGMVTWMLVNLPFIVLMREDWLRFYELIVARTAEWTSIYAVLGRLSSSASSGWLSSSAALNLVSAVAFALCCVALAYFCMRLRRPPSLMEVSFVVIGLFLLVNKVSNPQYSLWLLPFVVVALARHGWKYWGMLMFWGGLEVLLWLVVMWHMLGEDNLGVPHQLLDLVLVGRWTAITVMLVMCLGLMKKRKVPDA